MLDNAIAAAITGLGLLGVAYVGYISKRSEQPHLNYLDALEDNKNLREQLKERDDQAHDDHNAIIKLRHTVQDLWIGIYILTNQIKRLGDEPDWSPPDEPLG